MKTKIFFENRLIGHVYSFLDYNTKNLDKNKFITQLISDLSKKNISFAGFKNSKHLKQYLQFQLFDEKDYKKIPNYNFDKEKIFYLTKDALSKCHKELPAKFTKIFLFPSFSSFVKNKMGGVGGFSPWKNIILIDINPRAKGWETALKNSICHEYNHSVAYTFHKWESLLDSIIFEGLAEHFRRQVVGGKRAPWTKVVSQKECKIYFSELKKRLNSKSHQLYEEVFFGKSNYPFWFGYSLGYNIVRSFFQKNKEKSWAEIIKIKPKDILKQSDF
jgi:uncharacterized protein YjaZ